MSDTSSQQLQGSLITNTTTTFLKGAVPKYSSKAKYPTPSRAMETAMETACRPAIGSSTAGLHTALAITGNHGLQ